MPEEWKIIECCIEVLKPFKEAMREQSNSHGIIFSVISIIQTLRKKLDDHLTRSLDPIRLAVTTLKTEHSAKFATLLKENNLYTIATT